MNKHLHIVSFDVPYPADYGGVTDVFYKIKTLYNLGVNIHLHCFEYGRKKQIELNKYCTEVIYYKRKVGPAGISIKLPYIVNSRANKKLLKNILKDNYPVLLEGIHCTYFLYTNQLKDKKVFVRLHNVEHQYYHQLAKNENGIAKKIYYNIESSLLRKYEKQIACKASLLAISKADIKMYKKLFRATDINYLPAFTSNIKVTCKMGKGNYCLYQGNLSVSENESAIIWLINKVFTALNVALVIAGKNPSKSIIALIKKSKNVSLIANPSDEQMFELIQNAQINILPSLSSAGIKIKLINALYNGRHCLITNASNNESEIKSLCHIAEKANEFKVLVNHLMDKPFTESDIKNRKIILEKDYNNIVNAKLLMQWIY